MIWTINYAEFCPKLIMYRTHFNFFPPTLAQFS